MKKSIYIFVITVLIFSGYNVLAQKNDQKQRATLTVVSESVVDVPSIASQLSDGTFKPSVDIVKEYNPKRWGQNTAVEGKGLPRGEDPLWKLQNTLSKSPGKAPILTFQAASATATPTDPTGAVGPNHFVNSWNSSFRIFDKSGNPLIPASSLSTIFPGTLGDPIVMYDRYANRFFISEFFSNGFDVAVSKGPDPVNDGWWVYRFNTNTFPDYPKFSVWSDGYYITANKDQNTPTTSQVVFALERDAMLTGDPTAQMVGFPLPGCITSGFYSPLGFNCNGPALPPAGNAPIVYMQDDVWSGVSTDHLKIWNINVNWTTPANSTISSPQIINTTPFDGLFDGGSFSNLPQPSGGDIDALQATIMYMAQYRRFASYNSVVFNFVVDLDGSDDYSGIRWYELRQPSAGGNWTIYQEGTYSQPNGHSAFSGNMCMDGNGNIALAYTTVSTTQYPALRYTGRFASDPLNTMTMSEETIVNGTQSDPSTRYGDYSQMTIDPLDDATFWSIGEVFISGRKNWVGVFQFSPPALTADFTATPTSVCNGGSVTFSDASLGSPTSWNWSFPGGSPSSYIGQNPPAITYASSGSYNVTLTVGDGIDTDVETKTNYITVAGVIADFTGTPATVVEGGTVTFTDLSDCNPTNWSWTFEGGNPASYNGQNPPAIQYDNQGTFDVSLMVTNGSGNNTKMVADYITVVPPIFNMQNGTVTTCQGNFYDAGGSAGAYSNNEDYVLTFYSSIPGAQLEFIFTQFDVEYQSTCNYDYLNIYNGENTSAPLIGEYCGTNSPGTVSSANASGALTFQWHSDVSVTGQGWAASIGCSTNPPVANFVASNTTPAPGADVFFTDLTSGGPTAWAWTISPASYTFVNGTNAASQNPVVQFNDLVSYTITLNVSSPYGSDLETKVNYINVSPCVYCPAGGNTGNEEWISNVTFNTINNSSVAATGYTDYTSISTEVTPGSVYSISVSCGSAGSWVENYWVFYDWNQDCDFDDAGESYDLGQTTGPGTLSTNVTVPVNAVVGVTRMRAFIKYSSDPLNGCENGFSYGEVEDYTVNVLGSDVDLALTVNLEGPFNVSSMNPDLIGILPLDQPYNSAPWNYTGTESVVSPAADYVDWVLVELRDAVSAVQATSGTVIARQAAFVKTNGNVVAPDGNPVLTFTESISNNLFVVIHHRNHLSVMSANPVTQTAGVYTYDFSTALGQAYGGANGHKEVVPGIWAMFAADGNSDGLVNLLDESPVWENEAGEEGFLNSDYNLDGQSNNIDKDDYWSPNTGKGTQVPN